MKPINHHNEKKTPTVLVVEDDPVQHVLLHDALKKTFPDAHLLFVDTLEDAAKELRDTHQRIIAVALDNGFPLATGTARKGKVHLEHGFSSPEHEREAMALVQEGGAGAMTARFIRTGTIGAKAQTTKDIMAQVDALHDMAPAYKDLPIAWNSATVEPGKIETMKAALRGEEIDPANPKFKAANETPIDRSHVVPLDEYAVAVNKNNHMGIARALADMVAQQETLVKQQRAGQESEKSRMWENRVAEHQAFLAGISAKANSAEARKPQNPSSPEPTNLRARATQVWELTGKGQNYLR